jgi:hypothetical protein
MSIFDIFSHKRESVRILAKSAVVLADDRRDQKIVCYKCDRELGEDHDDERCARKGSTRRVFFGRLAATAAGAAVVAKVAPELFEKVAQSKPVQEIAAEVGLFGQKTKELFSGIAIANRNHPRPFPTFIVRRGDVIEVASGVKKVSLGYQYENLPDHPYMRSEFQRPHGHMETFVPKDGKIRIPHDMQIFTAYDADDDVRVALTIVRPGEADAIKGGVLIGAEPPKPPTDLEAYIAKRMAEGVTFDETKSAVGRRKLRERQFKEGDTYDMIRPTPMAMAAAAIGTVNYWTHYHPSMQRKLSLDPPLAKPLGYLPA